MGGASRGEFPCYPVFPVDPLAGREFVLVEVILVAEVGVGVDVSGVAAEDKHTVVEDDGRVVIARGWGRACGRGN